MTPTTARPTATSPAPEAAAAAGPRFLPEPDRGLVVFLFAPSLPWGVRMWVSLALVALGIALQAASAAPLPGAFLLLSGTAFLVVHGVANRPDPVAFAPSAEWVPAPIGRLEELAALGARMRGWDASPLDLSCPGGFLAFALLAGASFWLGSSADPWRSLVGIDAFVLLAPHWMTGMRRIDDRPRLMKKADCLREVVEGTGARDAGDRLELLALAKGGGVPEDLKLRTGFADAPDGFLGVHGQCVINTVQGTDHPYFYGVVVARAGFGLDRAYERFEPPAGAVKEWKFEGGVEVIVVRQATTRTSGYRTSPETARALYAAALGLGRRAIQGK